MKIDIDTLTIIDDETIRMKADPPRQDVDGGRDKLEQFGWEIIEPPSESSEDGEKWILEKNSYPIEHQITVDSRNAMDGIRFTHNLKEKNIIDGRVVKLVTSIDGAMRCDLTANAIHCVSDEENDKQRDKDISPYPSFDKFCETIWNGLREYDFF